MAHKEYQRRSTKLVRSLVENYTAVRRHCSHRQFLFTTQEMCPPPFNIAELVRAKKLIVIRSDCNEYGDAVIKLVCTPYTVIIYTLSHRHSPFLTVSGGQTDQPLLLRKQDSRHYSTNEAVHKIIFAIFLQLPH